MNQKWIFGMHRDYFYALTFSFDYLYGFDTDFDLVQSNKAEILGNNSQIWCKVKLIQLLVPQKYNRKFIKELKMKMPKLNLIYLTNRSYSFLIDIEK
jgi:hypothetical protein